jgi:hypothetical protein
MKASRGKRDIARGLFPTDAVRLAHRILPYWPAAKLFAGLLERLMNAV